MNKILPILLCACGPQVFVTPLEVTECGLLYRGGWETGAPVPEVDFGMLTRLEQLTIEHGLADCKKLRGINVWVRPQAWDLYGDEQYRAGSAYCNEIHPRIEIAADTPEVMVHELHHIEQRCEAVAPIDKGTDAHHADWIRTGTFQRIDDAQKEFALFLESRK